MDLQQLNELDLENIGSWPKLAKVIFVIIVCAMIAGASYYYLVADEQKKLTQLEAKEQELRNKFEVKAALAGNLPAYQKQVEE